MVSAAATGLNEDRPLTSQEISQIISNNKRISSNAASILSIGGRHILNVPLRQQINTYYCGVASTQMILLYKGAISTSQTTTVPAILLF